MSHGTIRDKHGISIELLADTDGEACRSYDVLQHKEVDGKRKTSILRSTFVIDKKGVIRHAAIGLQSADTTGQLIKKLLAEPA